MYQGKLDEARTLIKQKQYDEARTILENISENKTAKDWLTKLDQIAPLQKASKPRQLRPLLLAISLLTTAIVSAGGGAFVERNQIMSAVIIETKMLIITATSQNPTVSYTPTSRPSTPITSPTSIAQLPYTATDSPLPKTVQIKFDPDGSPAEIYDAAAIGQLFMSCGYTTADEIGLVLRYADSIEARVNSDFKEYYSTWGQEGSNLWFKYCTKEQAFLIVWHLHGKGYNGLGRKENAWYYFTKFWDLPTFTPQPTGTLIPEVQTSIAKSKN